MIAEKTLQTLEFDKVLHQLEEHASFGGGKEASLALRPTIDLEQARDWVEQTSEARLLLEAHPSTHLGGAHDIRVAVRRAEVGAILTPEELLEVGSTLYAFARFRGAVVKSDLEIPWLRRQAGSMLENRPFVDTLESTFSDRGEILDSASPTLRRIRTDIRSAQGRLMDRLNSMVTSQDYRTALQEPIVTMRNGRYVIPVRQDARTKVPGVVHDQSASGQTIFVEPLVVTEMNNRLKELELDERREIERILQELSARVADQSPALRDGTEALIDVDLAFAKAKYAGALRASEPRLNGDGTVSLLMARHPLLTGDVVPVTLQLGETFRILVITGPNTGGKTVALKTAGLLCLMAQAGLHVPADEESDVAVFEKIFADIGDEQSIEQSLSTFSSHMRNIVGMLPDVNDRSLVLLDELGAGTDPAEGAALARAVLTELLERNARAVVTTHYSELKTYAHEETGVENASVEFNVQTLSPTYKLITGLPGRSQALAIAKRLGMPQKLLDRARQNVAVGAVRVEKLLGQIQWERREIGRLYERARDVHADSRKLRDRLRDEVKSLHRDREQILAGAREEAASILRQLRARLRDLETGAKDASSRRERPDSRTRLHDIQTEATALLEPLAGMSPPSENAGLGVLQPLSPGSTVRILSLGQQATITRIDAGEAEVQLGQFKMRLPLDDLEAVSRKERQPERAVEFTPTGSAPPMEIDVRGWRADDALRELDQYLHDNYMHGQGTVRIVHGKGTGALRKAIRDQLSEHPLVTSVQPEDPKLGGEGVTVVKLST